MRFRRSKRTAEPIEVPLGASGLVGLAGAAAFGGVRENCCAVDGSESDLINRDIPGGFWDATGASLWISITMSADPGDDQRLRGYVGGNLRYDSTPFSVRDDGAATAAATATIVVEFQLMRLSADQLACTARVSAPTTEGVLTAAYGTVSVDFEQDVNLRFTAAAKGGRLCYQHGSGMYYPAPPHLVS